MKIRKAALPLILTGLSSIHSAAYASLEIHCSDPELTVRTITNNDSSTNIKLTYRTTQESEVYLYPPKTQNSFFALDAETGTEYELIGFSGIEAAPSGHKAATRG